MALRTSLVQYARYDVEATPGTPDGVPTWVSAGRVHGGSVKLDNQIKQFVSIGGATVEQEGRIKGETSLQIYLQNGTLAGYGKRSAYPDASLTSLTVDAGVNDEGIECIGSKIEEIEWSFDFEELLDVALTFMCLYALQTAGGTHATLADSIFPDFDGVVNVAAADYDCPSGKINLKNNLKLGGVHKTHTTPKRRFDYLKEGLEALSASFDLLSAYTASVTGDTLSGVALDVNFTRSGSTHQYRLQVAGAKIGSIAFDFQGGDDLRVQKVETPVIAPNSLTITEVA